MTHYLTALIIVCRLLTFHFSSIMDGASAVSAAVYEQPKRRFFARKKRIGKKKTASSAAAIRAAVQRELKVRGIVRPEIKHFPIDYIAQNPTTAFNTAGQSLLPGSQGTAAANFIGQQITAVRLRLRGSVYNGLEADTYQLRMFVVQDFQPMDSSNLILNSGGSTQGYEVLQSADIDSFINYNMKPKRFKVLVDQLFTVPPKGATKNEETFFHSIDLKNAPLAYAPAAVSGLYPVTFDLRLFVVGDTGSLFYWLHSDFQYTDS